MTMTMEVSETLERADNIVNMLDEICDHMDGFSSAEEARLSSITETLARGASHTGYLRKRGIRRTHVHRGFIWTSRCSVIGPAVGRVSADRHRLLLRW